MLGNKLDMLRVSSIKTDRKRKQIKYRHIRDVLSLCELSRITSAPSEPRGFGLEIPQPLRSRASAALSFCK